MDFDPSAAPSREELVALCREDPEAAADRMLMLWAMVEELAAVVATQGEEIARLKAKLAKDSHNSSKPPSSDRHNPGGSEPGKGKGKRGKKRKPGGQPGREGKTLRKVRKPDHIVELAAPARCNCGSELSGLAPSGVRTRQVFDLPEEVRVEVTEYRAPVCTCPGCGEKCAGEFPVGVAAPVQYGRRVRALATYLQAYHLLPFERLSEFFADVFGCPVATGTLSGFVDDAGARADPVHERTREQVRGSSCMHNDESGLSILGKMAWLHVACTKEATFFEVTPGRSFEDIRSVGVLEGYTGRSVHDFLPAYLKFDGPSHGLCNAHHLREFTYIEEELGQAWAGEMKALLLHAKRRVEAQATGGSRVRLGLTATRPPHSTRHARRDTQGGPRYGSPPPLRHRRSAPDAAARTFREAVNSLAIAHIGMIDLSSSPIDSPTADPPS